MGPTLVDVSAGNLAIMLMFSAAVVPFLALEATALGFSAVGVGALFAARALASTAVRLPVSLVTRHVSNRSLFLAAIAVDAAAAIVLGFAESDLEVIVAAIGDGIAFGTFLAASQSYVAESFQREHLGTALGAYGMAGSVGETAGGLTLGVVASAFGIHSVFLVAGLVLATTAAVCGRRATRRPHRARLGGGLSPVGGASAGGHEADRAERPRY
jgi:nitrate/nitrite transporter NarK